MKDYFSHDYNSRNDKKLVKAAMRFDLCTAIGAYWCIVEMLYEEGGYLLLTEYERICFELRTSNELITYLIYESELFKNDGEKFWSETAIERLKKRAEKSFKARESIEKRWNKYERITTEEEPKNDSNTSKVKESKVKESKINTDFILPDESFKAIVDQWLSYRNDLKKPYKTQKGVELFFNQLKKLSDNSPIYAQMIIDQSISHEWQGIFELKQQVLKQNSPSTRNIGKTNKELFEQA